MELRLKEDVLAEGRAHLGRILLQWRRGKGPSAHLGKCPGCQHHAGSVRTEFRAQSQISPLGILPRPDHGRRGPGTCRFWHTSRFSQGAWGCPRPHPRLRVHFQLSNGTWPFHHGFGHWNGNTSFSLCRLWNPFRVRIPVPSSITRWLRIWFACSRTVTRLNACLIGSLTRPASSSICAPVSRDYRKAASRCTDDRRNCRKLVNKGIHCLKRYALLILFQAYLLERSRNDLSENDTFEAWIGRHQEFGNLFHELESKELQGLTVLSEIESQKTSSRSSSHKCRLSHLRGPCPGLQAPNPFITRPSPRSGKSKPLWLVASVPSWRPWPSWNSTTSLGAETVRFPKESTVHPISAKCPARCHWSFRVRIGDADEIGHWTSPPADQLRPRRHEEMFVDFDAGGAGHFRQWPALRPPHRQGSHRQSRNDRNRQWTRRVDGKSLEIGGRGWSLRYGNRLLLHEEEQVNLPGQPSKLEIVPEWEEIAEASDALESPAEAYQIVIKNGGFPLTYFRVPVTDEQAPIPNVFDELVQLISADTYTDFIFNCQMG